MGSTPDPSSSYPVINLENLDHVEIFFLRELLNDNEIVISAASHDSKTNAL